MEINIGDKVRFLNDVGGGKVSGFQKGGIVLVEDEDGFEIPVRESEVVVVDSPSVAKPAAQTTEVKPVIAQKPRKEKPVEPTEEDIRIAELQEYYKKKVQKATANASVTKATTASVAPKQEEPKEEESLEARVIRLEMTVRRLQMRLERLEDAKALREKIKGEDIKRQEHIKTNDNIIEVDLHAHEVLETTAGMDAKAIKEYQLQTVRNTMNEYKNAKGRRIVFIHGNGEGVLRRAVIDILRREYPSCPYQDASFQQYGFGATMVTIR